MLLFFKDITCMSKKDVVPFVCTAAKFIFQKTCLQFIPKATCEPTAISVNSALNYKNIKKTRFTKLKVLKMLLITKTILFYFKVIKNYQTCFIYRCKTLPRYVYTAKVKKYLRESFCTYN